LGHFGADATSGPPVAAQVSAFLSRYASAKGIYMTINYVNRDHVHALVDLPIDLTIEKMMQLFQREFVPVPLDQ
jgi:hypothetical protein